VAENAGVTDVEMIIFVGGQGAGKSTFYRERFFNTHVRVSLDMLKTRNRERKLIRACLDMQQRFVVDNTNPTIEDRRRYFDLVNGLNVRVLGIFFEATLDELLKRNAQRAGKEIVPEIGVRGTFKKLERLSPSEGFDEIFQVSLLQNREFNMVRLHDEV
jgi:predicted kinase